MLKKLLKHEYYATYKVNLYAIFAIIAVTLFVKLVSLLPLNREMQGIVGNSQWFLYITVLISVLVIPFVSCISRFYRNMVSDEAYLTHTLPVKTKSIILSKYMVSISWVLLIGAMVILSTFVLRGNFGVIDVIYDELEIMFAEMGEVPAYRRFIIALIPYLFVSLIATFSMFYLSIALGQLFHKNRMGKSFAMYAIVYMASQIIMLLSTVIVGMAVSGNSMTDLLAETHIDMISNLLFSIILTALCVQIVLIVIYNVITIRIFKNRLNLE